MTSGGPDAPVVLTPEMVQALAGLHDLQLVEISRLVPGREIWPLLAMAVLVALLLLTALTYWHRRPRQRRLRRLARLAEQCSGPPGASSTRLAGLAELLRGVTSAAAMPPGLSGEAWLAWLDGRAPAADRGAFTGGIGRQLLVWPYLPESPPIKEPERVAELLALVRRWLEVNG